MSRIPGGVALIDTEDLTDRYTATLRDLLADTPGVFVQNRYGQEMRLSMRGSGLARGYHLRGIEILQDGIPVNLADGSGDFYQIDPLAIRSVQVLRGGNALRYGGSTLGGAIDFITPTAATAVAPNVFRIEGGSFGTLRLNGEVSRLFGEADAILGGTVTHSDGYRRHSRTQSEQFNGNVGYRISPDVETRFYLGGYVVQQQLPGALTLPQALGNPRQAAASALSGNQARDTYTVRLANRTTVRLDADQRIDVDVWGIHKSLLHPIFQVIDQDSWTWGIAPRYTGEFTVAGLRNELVVGTRYFAGETVAKQYVNIGGERGRLTLNARQYARNYEAYFENRLYLMPVLALVTGAKLARNEREYVDLGGGLTASRGYFDQNRIYDGFNPRLGLLLLPRPDVQVYANLTRSRDVPDFSDLTQTRADGRTSFAPLAAQRAWTVEVGTRGTFDRFGWDLTAYHSEVRGQMLQYTTGPDIPASTFNADRTVLQGVELGLRADLLRDTVSAGDRLTVAQVWTWNDFRFRNDRQFGNNRIAGAPEHVLRTTVQYRHPSGAYAGPVVDWVPQGAWADNANTLRVPGYTLVGLRAGVDLPNGVSVFLDARNLGGKRTISDVSTVMDARTTSTQIFYPGDGRSIYAGVRAAF
nr:TonB-dependent receptor [Roseomonas acroporae]